VGSDPGARGCTPHSCAYRDLHADFQRLKTAVFGVSSQDTEYQRELVRRTNLPYEILSDLEFRLSDALRLPTFVFEGVRLIKRLALVAEKGRIVKVFYPCFRRTRTPRRSWPGSGADEGGGHRRGGGVLPGGRRRAGRGAPVLLDLAEAGRPAAGIGAVAMEGGVHLLRRSRDPKVLAFSSPIVSGAIALLALSLGIYAAGLAAARTPLDEPAWLTPALYAGAAACGWIGLRAGWSAISGARKPPAA
jgi:hypothetical protein